MNHSSLQYSEIYSSCRNDICLHSCEVLNSRRDKAFDAYNAKGLPSQKVEQYKYTDVCEAFAPDYGLNIRRVEFPVNPYEVFRCNVPNMSTSLYFVENDSFCEKHVPRAPLPEGVFIGSLANFAKTHAQVAETCYGAAANVKKDAITALNTMFAQDCLVVYVPQGVEVERTVQVINILRSDVDLMANRRVLVIAEEGARISLLFCDHDADDRNFLTTEVVEVFAGKNSQVQLYTLEQTLLKNKRFSNCYVKQQEGSKVLINNMTLHGGLTRNKLEVSLEGTGAEIDAYGFALADGAQHVDTNALIDHKVGECRSNVLYKYVVDGESVGAFAGKVLVREGAEKTESQETNANLCVSSTARMFSQPMLEIYADDVKCNHGSTVGQLDDAAMFYMQQRGVSEKEARLLLEYAFVDEVLAHISLPPLKDRIARLVEKRFRGEITACTNCNAC